MVTAASFQKSAPKSDVTGRHVPVMVKEVIDGLALKAGGVYVDGTLGPGGHSEAILSHCPDLKLLIAFDLDQETLKAAGERLKKYGDKVILFYGNFKDIPDVLFAERIEKVDGVLLDLGISSYQLERSKRGFSFLREEPLDMRMDRSGAVTASELVNSLPEKVLSDLIYNYGEERWARRIAKAIIKRRDRSPILTSLDLARVVYDAVPPKYRHGRIHPATKTFQALRIAVNRELENLKDALEGLPECVKLSLIHI